MAASLQDLNLNALVQFEAIARHRSLKAAAGELHLTPPALTHALKRLERSLGVQLCERSRRTFQLTDAGQKLYARCASILRSLAQFQAEVREPLQFEGIVNVGVLGDYQDQVITRLLRKTLLAYPGTRLALQGLSSEEMTARLVVGELDLGLGFFGKHDPALAYRETRREQFRYYLGRRHPLAAKARVRAEDLAGQAFLWDDHRPRARTDLERSVFGSPEFEPMRVMGFSNNFNSVLTLLQTGRFVGQLPPSFARPHVASKVLRELRIRSDSLPVVTEEIVFDPRRELPAPARYFLDLWEKRAQRQ